MEPPCVSWTWATCPPDLGTWSDADYCSNESDRTPHGEECIDRCSKRGQDYYWCHKASTLWGFCTPEHLIEQLRQNQVSRELLELLVLS